MGWTKCYYGHTYRIVDMWNGENELQRQVVIQHVKKINILSDVLWLHS